MIYLFSQQLLIGLISCSIIYVIGKSILSFYEVKAGFFFRLFLTSLIGIITIVLIFSIIWSHGRTINIFLIPFVLFFMYRYRYEVKRQRIILKDSIHEILWIFGFFILLFLYQSIFFFNFHTNTILYLFRDDYLHALFSDSIKLWGSENYLTDLLYFNPELRNQLVPYHYPELWLNSFISKLFHNSTFNSYYLITNSILFSTFLMGICSLFKKTNTFLIVLFSVISLFITNVYSTQLPYLDIHSFPWDGTIMGLYSQKLAFISLFTLLSIVLFNKKKKSEGIIILLTIPLFSVTFMPGILAGIGLFTLLEIIESRSNIKRNQLYSILLILIFFISYFTFYHIYESRYTKNYASFTPFFKNWKLKLSIELYLRFLLSSTLFFVPYIVLLLRSSLQLYRYWIFVAFCFTGGIIATFLGSSLLDAGQFTSNISIFAIVILIVTFAQFISEGKWNKQKYIIMILICFIIISNAIIVVKMKRELSVSNETIIENPAFLQSIANTIVEDPAVILYFKPISKCTTGSFSNWYHSSPLLPLSQFTNKTVVFSIANPESFAKKIKMSYVDSNYYYQFTPLCLWYNKGKMHTFESFVKKYSIHYFYCMKGTVIPDFIIKNAKLVLISKTTQSKFYIVNLEN